MVSSPTFDDGVPHERIDADDWEDIYVVGDVHGCLPELESLLDELSPSDDDLVVFVGDLIRKGPDSLGVVELVREHDNFRSVRGNNEQKLLDGDVELDGFGDDEIDSVREFPAAISWKDALVVHGGVDPRKSLSDHSIDDLETTRSMDPDGVPPQAAVYILTQKKKYIMAGGSFIREVAYFATILSNITC